mmetsp:Transcript_23986/g.74304  ORF Transcript_23986/g.74304 Transcript_23986/m.74304 type:complete len:444 (-) Transcript_23986:33-1364(-)
MALNRWRATNEVKQRHRTSDIAIRTLMIIRQRQLLRRAGRAARVRRRRRVAVAHGALGRTVPRRRHAAIVSPSAERRRLLLLRRRWLLVVRRRRRRRRPAAAPVVVIVLHRTARAPAVPWRRRLVLMVVVVMVMMMVVREPTGTCHRRRSARSVARGRRRRLLLLLLLRRLGRDGRGVGGLDSDAVLGQPQPPLRTGVDHVLDVVRQLRRLARVARVPHPSAIHEHAPVQRAHGLLVLLRREVQQEAPLAARLRLERRDAGELAHDPAHLGGRRLELHVAHEHGVPRRDDLALDRVDRRRHDVLELVSEELAVLRVDDDAAAGGPHGGRALVRRIPRHRAAERGLRADALRQRRRPRRRYAERVAGARLRKRSAAAGMGLQRVPRPEVAERARGQAAAVRRHRRYCWFSVVTVTVWIEFARRSRTSVRFERHEGCSLRRHHAS